MPFVGINQKKYEITSYTTNMTKTDLSNTVNDLTELIKQQECLSVKPSPSSNICGSESSNFITSSEHHNFHDDSYLLVCITI